MSTRARSLPVYDSGQFRFPLVYQATELWRYRFLVRNMISRDLKVRYKRSTIGFIWVMLNPLLTMVIMTLVFARIFRFGVPDYPVYLLGGLLLWNLYAQGSNAAMASIQGNGALLRKLHVPPTAFAVSAIGSALVNLLFALVPFLLIALVYQLWPDVTWLFLVVPTILTAMFTLGIGLILGAMIVFFNDTFEIYQVLVQAYYFFTPVFYPDTQLISLPGPLQVLMQYNPMRIFLSMFRNVVLFHTLPSIHQTLLATGVASAVLLIGWIVFTRLEDKFAYHV